MKKLYFLAFGLLAALCADAQMNVVKEAERAMKSGIPYQEVLDIVKPAMSNQETQNYALTWFVPGKAAYKQYDELLALKQFNKLPDGGAELMPKLLIAGYENFMKAYPLDSLPDAKGKIKPKYSKEMNNLIGGHYSDYVNAGVEFFNTKNYKDAYKAWDIFGNLSENPVFRKAIPNIQADSIVGEIRYNQALAAWQDENLEGALNAFMKAKALGYNKKALYDYAIAVATQAKKDDVVFELAKEARSLYGKEEPQYLAYIINHFLQTKDFDQAFGIINEAIADEPNNSQYYVIQGILYENSEGPDARANAKASYKKGLDLDSNNAAALYNYGRQLCEDAYALNDKAPAGNEYEQYYNEKIRPLFLEAAGYLEDAYAADPNNRDALKYLENVYYNLHDEKKLEYTTQRLNQ